MNFIKNIKDKSEKNYNNLEVINLNTILSGKKCYTS